MKLSLLNKTKKSITEINHNFDINFVDSYSKEIPNISNDFYNTLLLNLKKNETYNTNSILNFIYFKKIIYSIFILKNT